MAWPVQYLRDHLVHVAVVAFFAAYPGLYAVATNSPVGQEMAYLLPRVETMIAVFYFGLFAMSFDFVSGYTGYLSFGHAAFYGAGAYLVVLASNGKVPFLPVDTPFLALLVLGGLVALALALVIGAVSFRLTGVYFAMITLGFSQVLYVFVRDWDYVGSNPRDGVAVLERTAPFNVGVPGVDSLNLAIGQLAGESVEGFLGFLTFSPAEVSYYMVGLVVVGCYFALQRIVHSPFGRVLVAIRENEERARAVGYDTFRYKLGAFALSAFFAGVAGGLFAGFRRSVTPENSFYFLVAGDALLASIIGGFGTVAGPLYGRLFDETVREFLSKGGEGGGLLPFLDGSLGEATLSAVLYNGLTVGEAIDTFLNGHAALYLGIVFVLFVLYVPNGLLGTLRDRLGGTVADRLPGHVARAVRSRTETRPASDDD
ncbi:amino acid/amide ABC transporter membrane protein 2, HAAT family [Halogeometricum rufum]|uniref:Amino acid/amide ABC transporter membrane protein 2, HAAT family n=1 Tax=Halogeometricum rufum TaxID=553469 RepID=A0A1I6IZV7_9EURY|nr:branched-chain amino acid ABC transporter permease [Halogeometricum rufum]SFR72229.1 amino acid/amide ABC transporter membrane protein 2, HAAT family [Halogeometricum rufum]